MSPAITLFPAGNNWVWVGNGKGKEGEVDENGLVMNKKKRGYGPGRLMLLPRILAASVTIALFFLGSALADDVVVLTEDNFEKEVGQDRAALVEFYAPWQNEE